MRGWAQPVPCGRGARVVHRTAPPSGFRRRVWLHGSYLSAATPRLRRMGADMLDAQLSQRPPDLGRLLAVDRPSLKRIGVVRPALGLEAHRQSVCGEHLLERLAGRGRAFHFNQIHRVDLSVASSNVVPGLDPGIRSGAGWP